MLLLWDISLWQEQTDLSKKREKLTKERKRMKYKKTTNDNIHEHILVCLSSSPSNARLVATAAKMAVAFGAELTALYVETPDAELMIEADKQRLSENIEYAKSCGAAVTTVYGDDIAMQISEFARISGVTKVVMGRSMASPGRFIKKLTLTEKIIRLAPNLDIHIIPDSTLKRKHRRRHLFSKKSFINLMKELAISALVLGAASAIGFGFHFLGFTESNVVTIYILAVLVTSVLTDSRICWALTSAAGVLLFNFFFTQPKFTFLAYDKGYPLTFLVMLIASLITGSIAARMKKQAKLSAQAAYRTQILLDTDQMLSKAKSADEILTVASEQVRRLTSRGVILYPTGEGAFGKALIFGEEEDPKIVDCINDKERASAFMAYENNMRTGAGSAFYSAECSYFPVGIKGEVYGVIGVVPGKNADPFEQSIIISIIGECALALENDRNIREKKEAAVQAENERLRADLLRAISHDLRTPLTSISGNAGNLLANDSFFDDETRRQIYSDIYDDSVWLISLVENLLSISRIGEGRAEINRTAELVSDVIEEALKHTDKRKSEHRIEVSLEDELMLADMDARLIVQVIVNLADNAIKYTPQGSTITVSAKRECGMVQISVSDNGYGIPDEMKERVFDLFYTGDNKIADSRRSLGLGLALCRSIVEAHGGKIWVEDNYPRGASFCFTLQTKEVEINE